MVNDLIDLFKGIKSIPSIIMLTKDIFYVNMIILQNLKMVILIITVNILQLIMFVYILLILMKLFNNLMNIGIIKLYLLLQLIIKK